MLNEQFTLIIFNFLPFWKSLLKFTCKEKKNSLYYQIINLFYSLKYLQINYYTPSDFQDNIEFFGNIIDEIEKWLKSTKSENLFKYFFQGNQNDIFTFQEGCTHHRISKNLFYSIQLQVQNKKKVYGALGPLTKGELMNRDNSIFCPKTDKKILEIK